MVQELTEPGKQLDKAKEIAHTIAKQAPLGIRQTLPANMAAAQTIPEGMAEHFYLR